MCCRGQRPGLGLRFRGVFKRMQPGCVFPPRDSDRSLCGLPSAPLPPPWRPSLIAGDRRPAGLAGRAAGRDSRAQPRRRQRWCGGGRDAFPTRASLAAHTRRPGRWCQVMCGVSRPTGEPWSVSRGSRHRGRECPGLAARHRPAHGGPAGRRAGRACLQPSPSPLLLPLRPLLRRRFGTCPQGPRAITPGGTVRPDGQRRTHTWGRPRTHLREGARLRAPRGSPTAPAQRYGVPAAGGGPAGVGAPSLCRGGGELPARFSAIQTPEFQQVQEKLEVPKARPGTRTSRSGRR